MWFPLRSTPPVSYTHLDVYKRQVETLTVEINAENFNSILKLFKDKLIENARGYNAKDDRMRCV